MTSRNKSVGILIVLGFVAVVLIYFMVMSGSANVSGTISVGSSIVSRDDYDVGQQDTEMIACNGYCIKGAELTSRELLSTKNKLKSGKLQYSFNAQEGLRHIIVIYLQLDHLTGEIGQTLELEFLTDAIKRGDLRRDFIITFQEINDSNMIRITVAQSTDQTPKVFEYPETEIPDIIRI